MNSQSPGITATVFKRTKKYAYLVDTTGKKYRVLVPFGVDMLMLPGDVLHNVKFGTARDQANT